MKIRIIVATIVILISLQKVSYSQGEIDKNSLSSIIEMNQKNYGSFSEGTATGLAIYKTNNGVAGGLAKSLTGKPRKTSNRDGFSEKKTVFKYSFKNELESFEELTIADTHEYVKKVDTLGKEQVGKESYLFDGKSSYNILSNGINKPPRVSILDRYSIPYTIRYGFQLGYKNLAEVLKNSKIVGSGDSPDLGKYTTLRTKYLPPNSKFEATIEFKIGTERGGLPIDASITYPKSKITYSLSKAELRGNTWVPMKFTHSVYEIVNGNFDLTAKVEINHKSVSLEPQDSNKFRYQPPTGALVQETFKNIHYRVGPNGEKIYIDWSRPKNPMNLWPGWLFTATVASLLVLTVFGYVWWKQKQWAKRS